MTDQTPEDLKAQRTRSAPLSIKTFPSFKQALLEYSKDKGYSSFAGFVLAVLANKIGWNGPT